MKNPFNYYSIVTGKSFCSRDNDIDTLSKYISNSANVVLFSKRRYGKTTLLKELFKSHLDKDIYSTYIDIYGLQDKYEFIQKLSSKIIEHYKVTDIQQTLKNLKNSFQNISFSLTINQKTAMPEIKPDFIKKDFHLLLDEVLDNFQSFLENKNQTAVIAIDEFQEILNINDIDLEAVLRTKIQHHTNISYIFTGSKQHILTSMFNDNKKPFYTLASNYELKPIGIDVYYLYVKERLLSRNIKLLQNEFEYIYDICDGETRIIQKIFYELFEKYENIELDSSCIDTILEQLNMQNDSVYKLLCDNLTQNQIITLKIIAKENTKVLSLNISKEYNISQQSIKSAINSLLKKELLYKENDGYIIYDKEFDFWLKR